MLKITKAGTPAEQLWILCGQLMGPWVTELRSNWERTQAESVGQRLVVDLREVTFVDESGEALLSQMQQDGAQFLASGPDTKDILANLGTTEERPFRIFLAYWGDDCK